MIVLLEYIDVFNSLSRAQPTFGWALTPPGPFFTMKLYSMMCTSFVADGNGGHVRFVRSVQITTAWVLPMGDSASFKFIMAYEIDRCQLFRGLNVQ